MFDTCEWCGGTLYPDDERVSEDLFCYHVECHEEKEGETDQLVEKDGSHE